MTESDPPSRTEPRFVVDEFGARCLAIRDTVTEISYDMRFTRRAAHEAADRRNPKETP